MNTTSAQQEQVRLKVSPDEMHATLAVSRGMVEGEQLLALCLTELRGKSVQITRRIEKTVAEQLEPLNDPKVETVTIELHGTPPTPGEDGKLEWAQGCAPHDKHASPSAKDAPDGQTNQAIDYYNQRAFITVTTGQPIVRIVPPTDGVNGVNLRGKDLPAKSGLPVKLRVDTNSVMTDADGLCSAVIEGLLKYDGQKLAVSPQLEIHGFVDFSTGNVDFHGDVQINKGIRDCFHVRASGEVIVDGPIESAGVQSGGDLHANRGIACHSASSIIVGRDLYARYLDTAHVSVKGTAHIEREIIQSTMTVGDTLIIEHGALIGGITCVGRKVRMANLGSDAEVPTLLYLAHDPTYELMLRRTREYLHQLQTTLKAASEELSQTSGASGRGSNSADKLTELMCRKYNLETQIKRLHKKHDKLNECYQMRRRVDMEISKQLHAGVRVFIDEMEYRVVRSMRGPLWIGWDQKRQLMFRTGDHGVTTPLRDIPGLEIMPSHTPCPDMQPPSTLDPPTESAEH